MDDDGALVEVGGTDPVDTDDDVEVGVAPMYGP